MPALVTAVTSLFTSLGFSAAAAAWLGGFVSRIVLSLGLSALSRATQKKSKVDQPGLTTETTLTGGIDPQAFVIGRYATGGQLVAPPMTHGTVNGTPNTFLTYVVALADAPGVALSGLVVDGAYCAIGGAAHPDYGAPVNYKGRTDRAWVKFYDGYQTAADPMLLAKYGSHPQRPWLSDMIGTGTTYAILTFHGDRAVFKGFPQVRFVLDGIPMYDPRKDPSVGGSGTQSWTIPATWARSSNPVVMIYNIVRGIALPGGDSWGGGWGAADLPLAEWIAAMNSCDVPVAVAFGGTEPQYQAGFEITVDREPADVIDELLKTCAGRLADIGGVMKVAAGAPGIAVKGITDDDIIVTDEQTHSMFPSLAQTHNGVHATFPDPASIWESRDAPPYYDATAEASDGRRLVATVSLPACPWPRQVQRLMRGWVNEERRFRRHQLVLPPDAAILEPLDVISWTSQRNGYAAKLFEVAEIAHDPISLLQFVSLREVDPADYAWNVAFEVPWVAPVPGSSLPAPQTVPSFAVSGTALDDANLTARRPALLMTWDGANQTDVTALEYEIRRLGSAQVVGGVTTNVASGSQIVAAGIVPQTIYEVRARFVAPRPTTWTAWLQATTPATYITAGDFQDFAGLFRSAGLSVPALVSALPPPGPARFTGELVYLTTDNRLYRWIGTGWSAAVDTADLTGRIASSQLLIADLSNLCEDPGFELQGAGWGIGGANGFATIPTDARTGARAAARPYSGAVGSFAWANTMAFDARAGDTFRVSGYLKRDAGGVCATAGVRISWLDSALTQIATTDVGLPQASLTTGYQRVTGMVTAPAGSVYARLTLFVTGHSAGTFYWDDIYCYRANGGELLVDGTISGNHIAANTITGGLIAASGIITQAAQITDAIITGAKIADLSVDTLQIADNAVTVPQVASSPGAIVGTSITITQPGTILVWGVGSNLHMQTGGGYGKLYKGGALIKNVYENSAGGILPTFTMPLIHTLALAAGTHTFTLRFENVNGNLMAASEATIVLMGVKK